MTAVPSARPADLGIEQWRAQLVRRILRILLIAGAIVAGPSVVVAIIAEEWVIAVVDTLALVAVAWLTLGRGLPDRIRAVGLVATPLVVGAFLLPVVPPAGQVYLLAVPVLAALLLGLRPALIALAANAVVLLIAGFATGFDPVPQIEAGSSLLSWVVVSLNLLFINGVMALSCAVLLQRLERALAEGQVATEALALRGAELQAANDDLAREMAERQRVEAHLRTADKLQALATLASGTAHDFNNVLGSILAVAERAGKRTDDPQMVDDLHAIVGACDRARGVVQQLVAFGGPADAGRGPVQVADVVATALPLLRAALPQEIDLVADLPAEGWITARPSEIEQVLTNLVTNAAQAMADAVQSTITLTVFDVPSTLQAPSTAAAVQLSVTDHGSGIPEEHIDRIFDPFFTTKRSGQGTGLGLSSVHGIVSSLGGVVEVDTTVGQGTTFHVRVPTGHPPAPAPASADDPTDSVTSACILLADDEDLIREMAALALRVAGHQVIAASDGREAVDLFSAAPADVDVLITDMAMPGLDGAALVREVRAMRPGLPVIVCSGHATADLTGHGEGRVMHLPKPYTTTQLIDCVGESLRRVN